METPPTLGPNPEKLIPWMRWVTAKIQAFEKRWGRTALDQLNDNKQLNSTVNQLSAQLNAMSLVASDSIYERDFAIPASGEVSTMTFTAPVGKNKVTIQTSGGVVVWHPTQTGRFRLGLVVGSTRYDADFVSPTVDASYIDYTSGRRAFNGTISYAVTLDCESGDVFTINFRYGAPAQDNIAFATDINNNRTLGYTATFYSE